MPSVELILGDCLREMQNIPDASIDAIITDPPYGSTACRWDVVIPLEPMWTQLVRIMKKNSAIVLFGIQPFAAALIMSNLSMFRYEWIWEKNKVTNFLNAKRMPLRQHENILVFGHPGLQYHPQKTRGHLPVHRYTKKNDGSTMGKTKIGVHGGGSTERYPTTIQKFAMVNQDGSSIEGRSHPTQKPIILLEYLINTYTTEGDTVLDFAAGTFSTGLACVNTNRRFIGIEKEEQYFLLGKTRIAQHMVR